MDTRTSKTLEMIIPAFRMQTQIFDNVLSGIKEEDALKRIEGRTNHIIWMAGNLVNCRYWLADVLGIKDKDPHEDLFAQAKALNEKFQYPSLKALKSEWHKISPVLHKRLLSVTEKELQQPYESGMKVDFIKENKLNMIGMTLDRQSYLFGQIGLMRRILGYEGIKYDINKALNY
ncbi:MAG: DinB family protein [Chitinophagaceae bacterium]|nr:MAG: DinB family protein [Chitinophagaceae bacterium]